MKIRQVKGDDSETSEIVSDLIKSKQNSAAELLLQTIMHNIKKI